MLLFDSTEELFYQAIRTGKLEEVDQIITAALLTQQKGKLDALITAKA